MTPQSEIETVSMSQRLDRMEQTLHDIIATLRSQGLLPQPSGNRIDPTRRRRHDDAPAPVAVQRLWAARKNAVAAAIRTQCIERNKEERLKLNGPILVCHRAARFRHILLSVRLLKPFLDPEGRPLPLPQLKPLVLAAMQGVPGVRFISGIEARARGLETSAACVMATNEFDRATRLIEPEDTTTPTTPTQ
jgi:hypothetical protein